jgi:hypothetical protein
MHLPRQSQPIHRATDGSRPHDSETDKSRTAGAGPGNGVQPSGYSDCYKLRGPAQQMCLTGYYS